MLLSTLTVQHASVQQSSQSLSLLLLHLPADLITEEYIYSCTFIARRKTLLIMQQLPNMRATKYKSYLK